MINLLAISLKADPKVVVETLGRIGIANQRQKILYPSCYLYEGADNEPFLVHFKQMFQLQRDASYDNISAEDLRRRNAIAFNLKHWGLIDCDDAAIVDRAAHVFVLPFKEKSAWQISHKYNTNMVRMRGDVVHG
jgi:hypothetical protein